MRRLLRVRVVTVIGLTTCASLSIFSLSVPASATGSPITCASLRRIGPISHPAIVSNCTDVAQTGGTGTIAVKSPDDTHLTWTIAWAAKHGTTTLLFTWKFPKSNQCPKGSIESIDTGQITGGTGTASMVITKGQKMSLSGCANPKTYAVALLKGTKLTL